MKKSTFTALAAGLCLTGCASVQTKPAGPPSAAGTAHSPLHASSPVHASVAKPSSNDRAGYPAARSAVGSASEIQPVGVQQVGVQPVGVQPAGVQQVGFQHPILQRPILRRGNRASACQCGPCSTGGSQHCESDTDFGAYSVMPPAPPAPYGIDGNEFLCNGWDDPPVAYVQKGDSIGSLDPTDVAVSFTTESGDIEVATSNEVCVYSPRFSSVRKITGLMAGEHAVGLQGARRDVVIGGIEVNQGGVQIDRMTELAHADGARRVDAFRERDRGVPIGRVEQVVEQVDFLAALANIRSDSLSNLSETQASLLQQHALEATTYSVDQLINVAISDLAAPAITRVQSAEAFVIYEFPDAGRLEVLKVVDKLDAAPGDEVTFAITATNVGDSPVDHIRLADNLTTRLAFVDGSQTSTPQGNFVEINNQAGSSRLVWTFDEPLPVGKTITVRFTCRVR